MRRMIFVVAAVVAGVMLTTASSCDDTGKKSQASESKARQDSYDRLTAGQPAHQMSYSPTRDTVNFWIDTWDKPGKLSYVYLLASNGQKIGYYVFKGLPVSYCAALTPTYEFVDTPQDGSDELNQQVPAPSVDGVYYSGGQCSAYYGKDASTGSYLEYTVGQGISALVYERPLPLQGVEPLGFTTIREARGKGG